MRKLLIVDDNADLLFALERLVSFYSFTVRTAKNSQTVLFEIESFKPEVVLIDVLLNGENGREICKSLRENPLYNEITLILFSASPKQLINFEECGADGIIEKPFGIKEFIEIIEATVQSRKKYLAN